MRCCKDIGIASELWDPIFIEKWKDENSIAVWCQHNSTKRKKLLWRRKDRPPFDFPWREGVDKIEDTKPSTPLPDQTKTVKRPKLVQEDSNNEFANMFDDFDLGGDPITDIENSEETIEQINFQEESEENSQPEEVESKPSSAFDINGTCAFGKYKGKTWKQVLAQKGIDNYLEWLANKSNV